jgi:hypothetical protein
MTIGFRVLGSVTTTKLGHPYNPAIVEEDRGLPHPRPSRLIIIPLTGTKSVLRECRSSDDLRSGRLVPMPGRQTARDVGPKRLDHKPERNGK